jgi:hypothetical protein
MERRGAMAKIPESYDDAGASIKIDPDNVYQSATVAVPALGAEIADSVNRVVQIWSDLKLGWVGNTAQEAQDFNDRWSASIGALFGGAGSTSGVLSDISDGIARASVNYGQAEDVVTNMFSHTASSLESSSPPPDGSAPDSHRASNDGPVTENG